MAKQKDDIYTADIFGKKPVGRPPKPNALTPAQRARAYRQRHRFNMLLPVPRGASYDEQS